MLELQKFLKMKDFFAENFGNFWKKVVLRKISGTFVFDIFRKIFLGALEWKGAQILEFTPPPPTGNRLARPCVMSCEKVSFLFLKKTLC
jgi:hypothetical protein